MDPYEFLCTTETDKVKPDKFSDEELYALHKSLGLMFVPELVEKGLTVLAEMTKRGLHHLTTGFDRHLVEKLEVTADYIRIPIATRTSDRIRTITISADTGIKALYDIAAAKVVTYLFVKEKWSVAEAKSWVTTHEKTGKSDAAPEGGGGGPTRFVKLTNPDEDQRLVTGIVYEPDVVDAQGDLMKAADIREAMFTFMAGGHVLKFMHAGAPVKATVLECYTAPVDLTFGDNKVSAGTWLMTTRITDDALWELVKTGKITGYSMGGEAKAIFLDEEPGKSA